MLWAGARTVRLKGPQIGRNLLNRPVIVPKSAEGASIDFAYEERSPRAGPGRDEYHRNARQLAVRVGG